MRTAALVAVWAALLISPAAPAAELRLVALQASSWQTPPTIQRQLPNVCMVRVTGARGSGTYLGARLVLTAQHVVEGTDGRAVCLFPDGQGNPLGYRIAARTIAASEPWDQALLELQHDPPGLKGAPLAARNPAAGDLAVVCGYSTGALRLRPGRVTQYLSNGRSPAADWYETNNPAQSGDSGGAILNQAGELIGNVWGANSHASVGQVTGRTHRFLAPWFGRLQAWQNALAGVAANGGRVLITPIFRRAIVNPPPPRPPTTSQAPAQPAQPTQCQPGGSCSPSPWQSQPYQSQPWQSQPYQSQPWPGGQPSGHPASTPPLQPPAAQPSKPPEIRLGIGKTETVEAGQPPRVEIRQEGADTLLDFYLPEGPAGRPGLPGVPGQPAELPSPSDLAAAIAPHLPPINVATAGPDGRQVGPVVSVPLGGQLNLHHRIEQPPLVPVDLPSRTPSN